MANFCNYYFAETEQKPTSRSLELQYWSWLSFVCCCGFTFELVKSLFPFAPLLARSVPSGVPFCKYCVPFHESFECVFLYKQSTIRSVQMEPNKFLKQKIGDHPSLLYNTDDIPRSMRTNTNTGVQGLWLWVSG